MRAGELRHVSADTTLPGRVDMFRYRGKIPKSFGNSFRV